MTHSKASILIVDDMPINLHLLTQILSRQGYQARPVDSGARALEAASARLPDLILLDIMMPEMDGYAVCQQLKADARTRDIPIIFLSALGDTTDKIKAFTAGGVDYITKPFQAEEVLARVQTHLALRALQTSLEQQVAELDAFAHTVAHDLKNPLGVITGFAKLLAQDMADTDNTTMKVEIDTIVRTGYKMAAIIDELLLLASVRKISEVTLQSLDMAVIVEGACERLAIQIAEHHAETILPAASAWPAAAGHSAWIEEVWINYISNAIKYGGRPPRVELGASLVDEKKARFWVRDNGSGLTPEEQSRLFTEFTRLHQVRAKGHGLGLSIVKRIVEKMNGEVGVESSVGGGSLFYFTLPLASAITS